MLVLAAVLLIAFAVAIWAMTARPASLMGHRPRPTGAVHEVELVLISLLVAVAVLAAAARASTSRIRSSWSWAGW